MAYCGTVASTGWPFEIVSKAASVAYATGKGTAKSGTDYVATSGTLSFKAGETRKTFTITLKDNKVLDGNRTVPLILKKPTGGGVLGTTKTAVLTILDDERDVSPPTASLGKVATVKAGATTFVIPITFKDNLLVNASTIGNTDVLVTGPHGYHQLATLFSTKPATNAKSIVATYQFSAPGGTWDRLDNGVYSILLQAKQVADTAGNFAKAVKLGTFSVSLATKAR